MFFPRVNLTASHKSGKGFCSYLSSPSERILSRKQFWEQWRVMKWCIHQAGANHYLWLYKKVQDLKFCFPLVIKTFPKLKEIRLYLRQTIKIVFISFFKRQLGFSWIINVKFLPFVIKQHTNCFLHVRVLYLSFSPYSEPSATDL